MANGIDLDRTPDQQLGNRLEAFMRTGMNGCAILACCKIFRQCSSSTSSFEIKYRAKDSSEKSSALTAAVTIAGAHFCGICVYPNICLTTEAFLLLVGFITE